MGERRPREPLRRASPGVHRVQVGRVYPNRVNRPANDNRVSLGTRLKRCLYWLAVVGTGTAIIWGNL